MMRKINWGIIGLGNIAKRFSDGFSYTSNSNLLAISSLNDFKFKYFKNKFLIDERFFFKKYEDLINCNEIDIVYITLPNTMHYPWIKKCIEKNKKILVEKPAFNKSEHCSEVKENILKKKLFFSEGYMYRYNPLIENVIETINTGELGNVISMESFFCKNILTKKKFFFFKKKRKIDPKSRLFDQNLGGGSILDLGCYPSSFSLLIASMTKGIDIRDFRLKNIRKEIGPTNVDIDAYAEIHFKNGFFSKIRSSFKNSFGSTTIIYFEHGHLIINNTWNENIEIIKIKKNFKELIKKNLKKNIYAYQIEQVSKSILENKLNPIFPGFTIEETEVNTKILENWINE